MALAGVFQFIKIDSDYVFCFVASCLCRSVAAYHVKGKWVCTSLLKPTNARCSTATRISQRRFWKGFMRVSKQNPSGFGKTRFRSWTSDSVECSRVDGCVSLVYCKASYSWFVSSPLPSDCCVHVWICMDINTLTSKGQSSITVFFCFGYFYHAIMIRWFPSSDSPQLASGLTSP